MNFDILVNVFFVISIQINTSTVFQSFTKVLQNMNVEVFILKGINLEKHC